MNNNEREIVRIVYVSGGMMMMMEFASDVAGMVFNECVMCLGVDDVLLCVLLGARWDPWRVILNANAINPNDSALPLDAELGIRMRIFCQLHPSKIRSKRTNNAARLVKEAKTSPLKTRLAHFGWPPSAPEQSVQYRLCLFSRQQNTRVLRQ
jgi:hypothetical protein